MFAYCGNNPVGCKDPSGSRPIWEQYEGGSIGYTDISKHYYSSLFNAVHVAGVTAANYTRITNREYAVGIGKTSSGYYYFSGSLEGQHDHVDSGYLLKDGTCAVVHSHPYCNGHDGNVFSGIGINDLETLRENGCDVGFSYFMKVDLYLAAPNGTLQRLFVAEQSGNVIKPCSIVIATDLPIHTTMFICKPDKVRWIKYVE